jgi:hypothetical protein
MEEESGYHATMKCTKVLAVRQCLNEIWEFPPKTKLAYIGHDWVLVLLHSLNHDLRNKMSLFGGGHGIIEDI